MEVSKILLVTVSGAGAPLARLYLIPKSLSGPANKNKLPVSFFPTPRQTLSFLSSKHTTRVVTSSQKNTAGSLPHTDQVTGSRGTEDAVLAHEQLLDTIRGADLCDLLDDLCVVVPAIARDDEVGSLGSFGDRLDDTGNEGFGVVGLLEGLNLLSKTGTGTINVRKKVLRH